MKDLSLTDGPLNAILSLIVASLCVGLLFVAFRTVASFIGI